MKINWKNFVQHDEDELLNPFIYLFMYMTFVWGLCFTFFPVATGASQTFLYELTTLHTFDGFTSIWGMVCLIVVVSQIFAFNYRKRWLGQSATMLGFLLWFYAAITYGIGQFWLGLLVGALPQVFFWVWLYITVERYHRKHG